MIQALKNLFKPKPKGQYSFKILNGGDPYQYPPDDGKFMYFIQNKPTHLVNTYTLNYEPSIYMTILGSNEGLKISLF